ncbi:MAG: DUF4350 domain-containing protein [Chitinophagaceae bacterium]
MKQIQLYKYGWCLLAMVSIFATCKKDTARKMPSMTPAYMYRDKEPMGTNIAWRLLPQQFNGEISLASKNVNGLVNSLAYMTGSVYISIGKNITLENEGLEQLLNYVDRGNEFFISADNVDFRLLDTLGIKQTAEHSFDWREEKRSYTSLRMKDTASFGRRRFGFYFYPLKNVFTRYDSSSTTVLGVNENDKPDFIVMRYGKGKFYFHTEPAAFSNYFLLTDNNTSYYSQVFSYLNKDAHTVYWGDTYRFGKKGDGFSALAIFWKNPMLKYALLLFCTLTLLYIAFGSKRKRRLVPATVPNTNDSLSFVHTIGNLYLQKKDNRNIAIKMMTYFLEHVRSNYFLNTQTINAEFIQALSRKSGVPEHTVKALMEKAEYVNSSETITQQELLEINNLVYEFYKR